MSLLQLPPEMISEIINKLDIEDVDRLCNVNVFFSRFCIDPDFWKRYFKIKYNIEVPFLIDNVEKAMLTKKVSNISIQDGLYEAAMNGDLEVMKWLYSRELPKNIFLHGVHILSGPASIAASEGHVKVLEWIYSQVSSPDFNIDLQWAASGGQLEAMDFIHSSAPSSFNWPYNWILTAAEGGNLRAIQLLFSYAPDYSWDYNTALEMAVASKNLELMEWVYSRAPQGYDWDYCQVTTYLRRRDVKDFKRRFPSIVPDGDILFIM